MSSIIKGVLSYTGNQLNAISEATYWVLYKDSRLEAGIENAKQKASQIYEDVREGVREYFQDVSDYASIKIQDTKDVTKAVYDECVVYKQCIQELPQDARDAIAWLQECYEESGIEEMDVDDLPYLDELLKFLATRTEIVFENLPHGKSILDLVRNKRIRAVADAVLLTPEFKKQVKQMIVQTVVLSAVGFTGGDFVSSLTTNLLGQSAWNCVAGTAGALATRVLVSRCCKFPVTTLLDKTMFVASASAYNVTQTLFSYCTPNVIATPIALGVSNIVGFAPEIHQFYKIFLTHKRNPRPHQELLLKAIHQQYPNGDHLEQLIAIASVHPAVRIITDPLIFASRAVAGQYIDGGSLANVALRSFGQLLEARESQEIQQAFNAVRQSTVVTEDEAIEGLEIALRNNLQRHFGLLEKGSILLAPVIEQSLRPSIREGLAASPRWAMELANFCLADFDGFPVERVLTSILTVFSTYAIQRSLTPSMMADPPPRELHIIAHRIGYLVLDVIAPMPWTVEKPVMAIEVLDPDKEQRDLDFRNTLENRLLLPSLARFNPEASAEPTVINRNRITTTFWGRMRSLANSFGSIFSGFRVIGEGVFDSLRNTFSIVFGFLSFESCRSDAAVMEAAAN